MATPRGMRTQVIKLAQGAQVHIYSAPDRLVLQLRHSVDTEHDLLAPSFKVAVELTPAEALALASELLRAAAAKVPQRAEH
jgi:hypothetical protein